MNRADFNLALRFDLYTFVQRCHYELTPARPFKENWHVELLCSALTDVSDGRERRLLVNMPPRNLKSLCVSIAFVAWMLGHRPDLKIMVVSYGQELAEKFGRDTLQIMRSTWYRAVFPATRLSSKRQTAAEFETTAGGGRIGVSTAGAITGRGADMLIVDDPTKADEALSEGPREAANLNFANTLSARLTEKKTDPAIVVMQRLHEDDLSGRLLQTGDWRHISLAAIAPTDEAWTYDTPLGRRRVVRAAGEALHPDREPVDVLEEVRRLQGDFHFTAQYQQAPVPLAGNLVPVEKFGRYEPQDLPARFDFEVLSLDTAYKDKELSDYSVCTHWARKGSRIYLVGVWRMKATYRNLKEAVRAIADRVRPHSILIEDSASGQALIDELRHDGLYTVQAVKPEGQKGVRMARANIMIEAGDVFIPREAPWLADYWQELAAFPRGRHDDQVDSTSQALNWFQTSGREPPLIAYYREEVEKLRREQAPQEPSVLMRPPLGMNLAFGIEGREYRVDWATGLMKVCEIDAPILRRAGYAIVDDASDGP